MAMAAATVVRLTTQALAYALRPSGWQADFLPAARDLLDLLSQYPSEGPLAGVWRAFWSPDVSGATQARSAAYERPRSLRRKSAENGGNGLGWRRAAARCTWLPTMETK